MSELEERVIKILHGTPGGEPGSELELLAAEVRRYVDRLEAGIRQHRDARGDDRCWRDDHALYDLLPEGYRPPSDDSAVELSNCRRYIEARHDPKTRYVSPQRRIEELEAELAKAKAEAERWAEKSRVAVRALLGTS